MTAHQFLSYVRSPEVAATGANLCDVQALDAIVRRWHEWMRTAKDVGIQTSQVLRAADRLV